MGSQGWHEERPRKYGKGDASTIPIFEAPRAPWARTWSVILISVLLVVAVTIVNRGADTQTREAALADEVIIQSRQALSLMSVETEDLVLVPMRELATTPSATRRVAATYAALDRGDGLRSLIALSLMSRIPTQVAAGAELGAPEDVDSLMVQAFYHPLELSEEEQQYLVTHVGWPARLLMVRDLEEADPQRVALHTQAKRNATYSSAMVAVGLFAAMLGSVLLLNFLQRWRRGQVLMAFGPALTSEDIYLESFAVYVSLMAVAVLFASFGGATWSLVALIAQVMAAVLGIFWASLRGVPFAVVRQDLGLHRGAGVLTELWAGVVGYISILPVFAAGVVAMVVVQKGLSWVGIELASPVHPEMVGLGDDGIGLRVYIVAAAVVFAPMLEEIMFRGALFRGLRSRYSVVVSSLFVGAIFAAVHPQGLLAMPALAAISVGMTALREWRDSLIAPMVAHALHNGSLIALTLMLLA